METIRAGVLFVACVIALSGWGLAYGNTVERDYGSTHAYEKYHKDTEVIQRTQTGEADNEDLHPQFVINL